MFPPKSNSQTPSGPPMGAGKPVGNPANHGGGKPSGPPFKKGKKKPKSRQGAMDAIGQLGISGYGPND